MRKRFIFFLFAIPLFCVPSWGQTWNLTSTMTATLDGAGVLTISTTQNAEEMPDYGYIYDLQYGYYSSAPWYSVRSNILSLVIDNKVTTIGNAAFYDCSSITGDLIIPNSVTKIGSNAFKNCTGFTGNLIIGNSVTTIGAEAFYNCTGFKGSLTFGNSVTTIGSVAFGNCSGFTGNLTIPNSVKTIEDSAFRGCSGFSGDLIIPNSVTTIGGTAFNSCTGFTGNLTISNSINAIEGGTFAGCSGFSGDLIIPNSVVTIGVQAFWSCSGFTGNLIIGNSVITIDLEAFYGCSGFTGDLIIPNSVKTIGSYAFWSCSGFTGNLVIGNSVTTIGNSTFSYCSGFTGNLIIGNSAETIGTFAFTRCGFTGDLIIPNTVTTIGEFAFSSCSGFTGNLVIGNSVTDIYEHTFNDCSGFTGNLIIGNSVTTIRSLAFFNCSNLTGNLIIPNSVTTIGNSAFRACSGLTGDLIIPNSVTTIGEFAFSSCSGFTGELIIPNTVTDIGDGAFNNSEALRDIKVGWATPLSVNSSVFYWNRSMITLHVPTGTKDLYQADPVWGTFGTIVEYDASLCSFPNLPVTNDFYEAACWLYKRGVLTGGVMNPSITAAEIEDPITRKNMANIAFRGVYRLFNRNVPSSVPSDYYPLVYSDLGGSDLQAVKALLYLEYDDGISPFDRNRTVFEPESSIARVHALKVLLETFDIQPDWTNTANPFPGDTDMNTLRTNNPLHFGYMRKAYDLGIIIEGRPFDDCKLGEAFNMLHRIMTQVEQNVIPDPDPASNPACYFEPLNVTIQNLAMGLGMESGNFNHYTKTSFALDGVVPLDFTHTYNSYNAELPDVFFGMTSANTGEVKTFMYQPLGPGWSHSYHSFITQVNDRCMVHWGGGTIHVYKISGSSWVPESAGVYDELTFEGTTILIKTKSQIEYRFRKNISTSTSDGVAKLSSITDRNGNTLTINYGLGVGDVERIASVSDGNRSLTFTYLSGTNLISKISDPLGREITFDYTTSNFAHGGYMLIGFRDAKNNSSTYHYLDNSHPKKSKLLSEVILPKGNSIKNDYDVNRRLTKSVSSLSGVPKTQTNVSVASSYTAGAKTMSSTVQTYDGSSWCNFAYNFNANNNVTKLEGNQNLKIEAGYGDNANPVLPTSISSNSGNSDIQYDGKGNVTKVTQRSLSGADTRVTNIAYNNRNDVTSVTDPKGNVTYYDYNGTGNLTAVRAPENSTTNITVDSKGLPIKVTNPEGIVTDYAYNSDGNLQTTTVPALSLSSTINYDLASRVIGVTDFLNRTTSFTYDANDNLLTERNAANHTTSYAYDINDNMITITNAEGGVTTMTYDTTTDWLTSVSFGGSTKQYQYNDDGSMKTFIKPDGTNLNSTYDNLGRITGDGVNAYTYDSNHRLATIAKDGKTLTFEYDGFNRITGVTYSDFTNNKVSYTYDNNGNMTTMVYPDGKTVTYTYDNLNRLKTVRDWNSNTITYNYLKDSRLQSVSYPNGMTVSYTYDNAGRQTGKTVSRQNSSVIVSYSFTLDNVGNIENETRTEPYGDVLLAGETTSYSYNSANRITQAGSTAFTFDANGNTKTRGGSSYNYDMRDKLTSGDGFSFEYDGLGNIRSNGTKRYMIDISGMGNVIAETNMSGTPTAYYIYGAGGLEARISLNGTTHYYVSDFRGSVVAMVDATTSANVTHKYQYDDFGNVVQKEEADNNDFRYVGKYGVMYASDNLYYMRARFYDPTIGRFLTEDPIWSTNLYPYADNNPVMGIDPRGLLSIDYVDMYKNDKGKLQLWVEDDNIRRDYPAAHQRANQYLNSILYSEKEAKEEKNINNNNNQSNNNQSNERKSCTYFLGIKIRCVNQPKKGTGFGSYQYYDIYNPADNIQTIQNGVGAEGINVPQIYKF